MTDFSTFSAYELVKREELPDIHAEGILLRHKKSGARLALIPCSDSNKVFYITFRTPPCDSTGAAHIIEHTVLCGSEKYPLKDPFIELLKGSLNTYLNATTYPDRTMYPVASTNDRDFRNLVDVYLDAVFHPNIYKDRNIFRQEGWSFRMESEDDPLTVSGVVYNEMKGAYSSPDEVMDRKVFSLLFPDTPYGQDSGGDPDHITDLTYDTFLNFHRKYYHPSNSYLYLYGDFPVEEMLRHIDEAYLSEYEREEIDSAIALQAAPAEPLLSYDSYPVADGESEDSKTCISLNYVTGDRGDLTAQVAMDVLDYALFSMPGAPVRKAVTDAGIGDEVYGSYSDGIAQPYFSVVVKNAEKEDYDRFRGIVEKTLEEAVENGIDADSLLAGIGSMEFQFREADYFTWPKGLIYGIDMMDSWLFDDDAPFEALKQLSAFACLREHALSNDGYFENLVKEKFLDNTFRADVVLCPVGGLQEENDRKEEERLAALKENMSAEEIRAVIDETEELRVYQEREDSEEALRTLPVLRISDLEKSALKLSNIPDTVESTDGTVKVPVIRHEALTRGISYTQLLFRADFVPEDKLIYLALLRSVLLGVNTEKYSYTELTNAVNRRTGGISSGITAYPDRSDRMKYRPYFVLRGKALYRENGFLNECFAEVLTKSDFRDYGRIREIIAALYSRVQMNLIQSGHSTAVLRALAYCSPESAFHDAITGLSFYRQIEELYNDYENRKETIADELESLSKQLFSADNLLISCTTDADGIPALKEGSAVLIDALKEYSGPASSGPAVSQELKNLGALNEGFITGGQVQHVAMAGDFGKAGFSYSGALQVLRHILNYGYLWEKVRIDGNAYGCSISFTRNGIASIMSLRDPHLGKTLDAYRGLADYVEEFDADPEEMEKYIIGTISSLDTPLTPSLFGAVSMRAYLSGMTSEDLQRERDEVLSATAEDIRKTAPLLKAVTSGDLFCVVGSESSIRKHEDLFQSVKSLL